MPVRSGRLHRGLDTRQTFRRFPLWTPKRWESRLSGSAVTSNRSSALPSHEVDIFCRWTKAGVWQRITDVLRDRIRVRAGRSRTPTAAVIDSQSVRGADTVPTRSRGWDNGKKVGGRKHHIATDTMGLLPAAVVTAASTQDRDGAVPLLARLRERFSTITLIWADAGYTGRLVRWAHQALHLTVVIVKRADPGFVLLPRRWVVERTLAWLSKHRRCVRDYETRPDHHEAMIYIATIMTMSRRLTRT